MTGKLWRVLLIAMVAVSAAAPFVEQRGAIAGAQPGPFPGWPQAYEGAALTALPMTAREDAFARDFPGRIGRFSDGRREIVLRYVSAPTRRLHPASDCYRGLGYAIEPGPLRRNARGEAMGCFVARKGGAAIRVCEGISTGQGQSWSDVSQWYWEAMLGRAQGPWWSVVVAEAAEGL